MATKKTGKATEKLVKKDRQTLAAKAAGPVLRIKGEQSFRGARAAWFEALRKYDGQSPEAFLEACKTTPPVLNMSGKAEDPRGWLRYFVREGVAAVEG